LSRARTKPTCLKNPRKKNMQSLADDKSQSYVYMISCRGGRIKRVYLSRWISKNLKTFLLFILWIIELRFFSTKWVVLCKYSFVVFRQKSLVSLWPIVHDFIDMIYPPFKLNAFDTNRPRHFDVKWRKTYTEVLLQYIQYLHVLD
jgi:hypothetical protein